MDGGGEAFEHREDRRERVLDGAEPTLDGGLVRRCSFALRRVLDADRVVGALGSLGHVRRALVGDELGAGEPGCGIGSDALDELSALALVHGERSEQVAFAVADVLDTDELEVDAEHAQIRRVATELRPGGVHVEVEPTGVGVVGGRSRRSRCRCWRRWLRGTLAPRSEGALGPRERRAELASGDAVLGVDAVERADELVLDCPTADGHVAQREEPGRDREQGVQHRRSRLARRRRPTSSTCGRLDEVQEDAPELRLEPADPLGAWSAIGDQLCDRSGEPRRIVVGDSRRPARPEDRTWENPAMQEATQPSPRR